MRFLHLLWKNLGRKKVRTGLTVLSILIAFLLYGYLGAIRQAFSMGVEVAGVDRLIVRHKVSIIQFLPESYETRIERVDGVVDALHQTWFGGIYQNPRNFFAQIPVDAEEWLEMYPEFRITDEARERWLTTRTGAIVGRATAERFGWKVGDRIPIQATIWTRKGGESTWEFDIVGIYDGAEKATDTTQFFFRHDYFDEARAWGSGNVGWYVVKIADPERAAEIAREIDAEFANSPAETKAEPEGAFVQGFAKQVGNIGKILIGILSAVFFTILLVAGNTMAQTVRERTRELAAMKAIGFTDRGVLGMVLAESCLVAAVGGLVGLGLAWLLISRGDPTGGSLPIFFLPPGDLVLGLGLIGALGLAAGLLPALQASRLKVADALRR